MDIFRAFSLMCNPGQTVLDIGANVGVTAKMLSICVGSEGTVYAFEADPRKFAELSENLRIWGLINVRPVYRAVSDRDGHCFIYGSEASYAGEASTIITDLANEERLGRKVLNWQVESEAIDGFCRRHSVAPSFLKVDVEGAEPLVLSGCRNILETHRPSVYFEFGYDGDIANLKHIKTLNDLNYILLCADVLHFKNRWISMNYAQLSNIVCFLTDDLLKQGPILMNILAIPQEKIDLITNVSFVKDPGLFLELVNNCAVVPPISTC